MSAIVISMSAIVISRLTNCIDFCDERADVKDVPGGVAPNDWMKLQTELETILELTKLEAGLAKCNIDNPA